MKRVVKNGVPGPRQTHMNATKFDPNKYKQKQEQLAEKVLSAMTTLCCARCCEIIQWKVDYGKYIPLEVARKCNLCGQKNVTLAYHRICRGCAVNNARCAKCQKRASDLLRAFPEGEIISGDSDDETEQMTQDGKKNQFAFLKEEPKYDGLRDLQGLDIRALESEIEARLREESEESLKRMPERKRRTVLRTQRQSSVIDDDDKDDELL